MRNRIGLFLGLFVLVVKFPNCKSFTVTPRSQALSLPKGLKEALAPMENNEDASQGSLFPETLAPSSSTKSARFDIGAALFCAGLAFDAYVEPASNSSRWEKGSQGLKVAFISPSFTRSLYKGLLQVQVQRIYDLPDEDDTAEWLVTGDGVDAYLLVAAVEGRWKEDIKMLEQESYHEGVLGLQGSAHVGRSRTAWSNINEAKSNQTKCSKGLAPPYHVKSSWGKGGEAIFTDDEPPFYLYLQDPETARLVFTVMDDDVIGRGAPIGSAHDQLSKFIPDARLGGERLLERIKDNVLAKIRTGEIADINDLTPSDLPTLAREWQGEIKLTSKPRLKDKNGQLVIGAAAGAWVAGPVGAAAGAALASMWEGTVRGRIELKLRYLPIPPVEIERKPYIVKGGLPGVDWGEMYVRWLKRQNSENGNAEASERILVRGIGGNDLEHCFFVNHDETGCTCSVYRSLEKKLIVVSFRGTCEPVDLITDASLAQDAWVEGEDIKGEGVAKVHVGFRNSLNSIARRLKELLLAVPGPGDSMSDYTMYVTGHSLGGALATLFTLDIAEFGIDAGRALPQKEASEAWWKSIASTIMGSNAAASLKPPPPPRPKSLRMYNFGSPRVGNQAFCGRFADMQEKGFINEAFRVVNGDDVVARVPRSFNMLAFGNIAYDHCAPTVLVTEERVQSSEDGEEIVNPKIWIEGESSDELCPVRDGTALTSPFQEGSLLSYIVNATQESFLSGKEPEEAEADLIKKLSKLAEKLSLLFENVSASEIAGVVGIDPKFAEREWRIIQSLSKGDALAHHLEDSYYASVGRACGFVARVGHSLEDIM